jgi:hypothetical protein
MNKTWVTFQDLFTAAHETYESLTALAGGYHGANHVSRSGIQPIPKKVEAIKNMVRPTTRK